MYRRTMRRRGRTFGRPVVRTYDRKEQKFSDTVVALATATTTGVIIAATVQGVIAQGVTESTRIGRMCVVKSIAIRGLIRMDEGTVATSSADIVRIVLTLDKQANGTSPAILDMLEAADVQSFNNLSHKNRFVTLMDKTMSVRNVAAGGNGTAFEVGRNFIYWHFFKRMNIPIEYENTTGTLAGITSNNLLLWIISEQGTAEVQCNIRARFTG